MKPTTDMLVWVSNNRGKLTAIADQAKCSPQFVHLVLRGERSSKTGIVEKLLREYGAPITDTEAAPV